MWNNQCSDILGFRSRQGNLLFWRFSENEVPPFSHIRKKSVQFCFYWSKKWSESHSVVSNSLQPHGLCSPWSSLGQNTEVDSHSLLQGIFPTQGIKPRSPALQVDSLPAEPPGKLTEVRDRIYFMCRVLSRSVVSDSLWPHGLYSPWNSLGQYTGVGSLSLPQEIFPTQGSNPGLPHCRRILYQLSYQGSPSIS